MSPVIRISDENWSRLKKWLNRLRIVRMMR